MTRSKESWALESVRKGLAVFPIHWTDEEGQCSCGSTESGHRAGKHPFAGPNGDVAPQGVLNATMDEAQVREWWGRFPDANIGAHPGEDFVVVDLDVKSQVNGIESIEEHLGVDLWELEGETFTVKTPTGGYHLYYRAPHAFGNGVGVLDGVDTRGLNGYVLAPGSEIGGKAYVITSDVEVAPLRDDVSEVLRRPRERQEKAEEAMFELDLPSSVQRAKEFLAVREPAVEGNGGDNHTFVTLCLLKDMGVSQDKCAELIMEPGGWNERCDPPWDMAELSVKMVNVFRYGKDRPGSKGGGIMEMFEGDDACMEFGIEVQDVSTIDFEAEDKANKASKFKYLSSIFFQGIGITKRNKRREYIIPEWLPAHGFTALLAKRSVGKTVTMMDLALRLSCDMEWHGLPMKNDVVSVYLCGEDDEGAGEQVRAWCQHHGKEPTNERFFLAAGITDLMSAEDVKLWADYLHEQIGDKKCVVFVDTWQRAAAKGGQNSDEDMQKAVHHIEQLAKVLNGPVIAAFHPPKHDDRVVMGSSIIENSTTAIWNLSEQASNRKLEVTRIKGKGHGNYALFKFQEIGLGEKDEFGKELSGVIPLKVGGVEHVIDEKVVDNERAAFAHVIVSLDLERKQTEPESKQYTVNAMAAEIENLLNISTDLADNGDKSEDAQWAEDLIDVLKGAGVVSMSATQIKLKLKELFQHDPRGYEMDDNQILRLRSDGTKYKRFFIDHSGM